MNRDSDQHSYGVCVRQTRSAIDPVLKHGRFDFGEVLVHCCWYVSFDRHTGMLHILIRPGYSHKAPISSAVAGVVFHLWGGGVNVASAALNACIADVADDDAHL